MRTVGVALGPAGCSLAVSHCHGDTVVGGDWLAAPVLLGSLVSPPVL